MVGTIGTGGTDEPGAPRFLVDAMLGRLARWLRLLGYDTAYDPTIDDREIARRAVRERRIVLSRDHGLLARRLVRSGLFVDAEDLGAQLRQVVAAFGLRTDDAALFRRCALCNGTLEPAAKDEVAGVVPPFVWRTHDAFARCTGCGRVFWAGTHDAHARAELHRLLGDGPTGERPPKNPQNA